MECIICRRHKEETDFFVEHIIPYSLGNSKLRLYNICKECNSRLGSEIEYELINFEAFSYPRIKLDLKGKKGILPKMFRKARLEDGRPAFIDYNKTTGKLEIKSPPSIKLKTIGKDLKYEVKGSSIEEILDALRKKHKRRTGKVLSHKKEDEIIKSFNDNTTIDRHIIRNTWSINNLKIELSFFKIAYELIFYFELLDIDKSLYLKDDRLIEVSKMISDYIYKEKKPKKSLVIKRIKDTNVKNTSKILSKEFFNHKYSHTISINSLKDERKIRYNINLLNSLDFYIEINNIDCKDFHKNMLIDPVSYEEVHF